MKVMGRARDAYLFCFSVASPATIPFPSLPAIQGRTIIFLFHLINRYYKTLKFAWNGICWPWKFFRPTLGLCTTLLGIPGVLWLCQAAKAIALCCIAYISCTTTALHCIAVALGLPGVAALCAMLGLRGFLQHQITACQEDPETQHSKQLQSYVGLGQLATQQGRTPGN